MLDTVFRWCLMIISVFFVFLCDFFVTQIRRYAATQIVVTIPTHPLVRPIEQSQRGGGAQRNAVARWRHSVKVEARFPAAPLSSPPPPSFVHRRAPLPPPSPPPRRHRCATIAAPPPLPPPCYHHHETAIAAFIATALVAPPLPRRPCRATVIAAVIATSSQG